MEIELKCYAKVNLSLDITGLQDNGYHNLDMIMTNIDLFDLVRIVSREDKIINIFCDLNIPKEKNSAYLIAEKFINKFDTNGADIYVNKNIPLSGGLGGSSADAAGVVFALCKIYNIDIEKTFDIVNSVGSDIWYLIKGGMQRAKGKGEILTPIEYKEFYFVLAKPENGVNTSLCFKKYDELKKNEIKNSKFKNYDIKVKGNIDKIIERIVNDQILKGYLFNVLTTAAISLNPEILPIIINLSKDKNSLGTVMSGSGSSVISIYNSIKEAENGLKYCKNCFFKTVVKSIEKSIEIIKQI